MAKDNISNIGESGIVYLLGSLLGMGGGFLFRLIISNNLSKQEFGSVMLALSMLGILSIPTVLGLNQGIVRYIPQSGTTKKANEYATSSLSAVLVSSSIAALIAVQYSQHINNILFGGGASDIFIFIFIVSIPVYSLVKVVEGGIRAKMETKNFIIVSQLVKPGTRIGFAAFAIVLLGTVESIFLAIYGSFLATILFGVLIFYNGLPRFSILTLEEFNELFRFSIPLLISSSVYLLLTNIDRVLIAFYKSPAEVGVYEVALTIALLLTTFKSAFSFIVFPKISKLVSESNISQITTLYQQTTKWIITSTTPGLLIVFIRPDFLVNLFGSNYLVAEISTPLSILAIAITFDSIVGPNGQALLGFGKSRSIMYFNTIALISNVFINILLIPMFGIVGAAIGTTVGYIIMNLLKCVDLFYSHGILVVNQSGVKASLPSIVLLSPVLIYFPILPTIFEAIFLIGIGILSIVLSVMYLIVTGSLSEEDRDLINTLLPIDVFNVGFK